MLETLKYNQTKLEKQLNSIENELKINNNNSFSNISRRSEEFSLPITSNEELDGIENKLRNKEYFQQFVNN